MSKKSKSSSSSTSTSTLDKWQTEQWKDLYGQAQKIAANPYQQYGGPTVAGFNNDQTNAFDIVRQNVAGNVGGAALDDAMAATRRATTYTPQVINATGYNPATASAASVNRGDVRNVNAGSILDRDVGAYMNPFLKNVAANAMSDLERTRAIQMMQGADAAKAAGAFGGSRHGVADAETNRNFYDVAGKTLTNLYSTGYDNALGLAGQDLARDLQAQTSNQGVDLNVANTNAGFIQQANLSNQDATNAAARYGADSNMLAQTTNATNAYNAANLGLSAGQQLASMSDQERQQAFGDAALMEQIGNTQQAQTQREYDDALLRWQDQQGESLRDLGLQASVLGGMPILSQTTTGSATGTQTPSVASQIGSAVGTIGSLMSMFSDKNMKSGVKPVSEDKILRGIEKTPVSSWQYDPAKGGPADGGRRHTGPMAQDVAKNLGLGDGRTIPVVDAIGTQFAATKALAKKVKKLEAKTKKGNK